MAEPGPRTAGPRLSEVRASGEFDADYYLRSNPDVAEAGVDPCVHFLEFGWKEGRNPSPGFNLRWYAETHLGGASAMTNALLHYLDEGRALGLDICPQAEVMEVPSPDPEIEAVAALGVFDAAYYVEHYPDVAECGIEPIRHFVEHGAREGRNPCAMFDTPYYLANNPDVAAGDANPLLHFCRSGWKGLRNPSPDFDLWWYWSRHLDPASEAVNPLAHYQESGRKAGLETRPPERLAQRTGAGYRHPGNAQVRRICLFAGHDRDGLVDDTVVDYVRELSRHADVYYLADCELAPGELDKLAPYTKARWAQRHGEYDFGSYSRLVRDLVGWERIAHYDELLLVNDSSYLLRPLDDVFMSMDARACDWWGLQATKGIASTRDNPRNAFRRPIPIGTVKAFMLDEFETDYDYDFLVGSYFLAFRRPVTTDARFRRLLDSVVAQENKRLLIKKYEIGLTRHLIADGHAFDTYIDQLYPFHPIFSNEYFRLVRDGFPLLKRHFLAENHYRAPRLREWEDRLASLVPDVDLAPIRRNLARLVNPAKLEANLNIGMALETEDARVPENLLDPMAFQAADQATPKYGHWWVFPACAFSGEFSGNERGVFEEVKDDPEIKKIILTRGKPVVADGTDVVVVPLESPEGQYYLMRAGNIFIKHSPTRNLVYPVEPALHNLINLWHGVPLKRIGFASHDMQNRQEAISREHAMCRAVIAASKVDRMAMASAFYPLTYKDVWVTGLPRNDFIVRPLERLPADMREEHDRLKARLQGRKLVLFMPTFRNSQDLAYYRFSDEELDVLTAWLERHGAVIGVREHMADTAHVFSSSLSRLPMIDLGQDEIKNVEILYRAADLLVTDYSSCFVDFMLTGKPAISFAYDLDHYVQVERGLFYDIETVFPGPVCRDFSEFEAALARAFEEPTAAEHSLAKWRRKLFFDRVDDQSSARVVANVKDLMNEGTLGTSYR